MGKTLASCPCQSLVPSKPDFTDKTSVAEDDAPVYNHHDGGYRSTGGSTLALPTTADISYPISEALTRGDRIKSYIMKDVDSERSTLPMALYCFMTGYIDVISFSATFVWTAFQTGNTILLALALARLFVGPPPRPTSFLAADKHSLTSLTSFLLGSFVGRIGDRIGSKSRFWLCMGTLIQALLTGLAAIAIWQGGETSIADRRDKPSWTHVGGFMGLGLMSASMGLQGIMGKRVNTHFSSTAVLTAVWCELMADPNLFHLRSIVTTRDHRIIAIAALFVGGFLGRALLVRTGAPWSLAIGAALRVMIAINFLFIRSKNDGN